MSGRERRGDVWLGDGHTAVRRCFGHESETAFIWVDWAKGPTGPNGWTSKMHRTLKSNKLGLMGDVAASGGREFTITRVSGFCLYKYRGLA
jgi:hypothetical protein